MWATAPSDASIADCSLWSASSAATARRTSNISRARFATCVCSRTPPIRQGRRPSFDDAASPEMARPLYENVVRELESSGVPVATGEFQAAMQVSLVNDGPVTVLIDGGRGF